MRGIHNILYLILIAALATNNFTVNNLFSSIEKKDASSHLFDDEEDGGFADAGNMEFLDKFRNRDGHLCVLAPSGLPIILSGDVQQISFVTAEDKWQRVDSEIPIGTVGKFVIDGQEYTAKRSAGSNVFNGFGKVGVSGNYYVDSLSQNYEFLDHNDSNYTQVILGVPCIEDGIPYFKVFPSTYFDNIINPPVFVANYKAAGSIPSETFITQHLGNEALAEKIPVSFSQDLSQSELEFFQFVNQFDVVCGVASVYAFSSAQIVREHPELLACLDDAGSQTNDMIYSAEVNEAAEQFLNNPFPLDNLYTNNIIVPGDDPLDKYYSLETQEGPIAEEFHQFFNYALRDLVDYSIPVIESPDVLTNFSLTSLSKFFDLFSPYQRMCILKNLAYDVRIELIKSHEQWGDWTTRKESLLVDLIRTTPVQDQNTLLNELEASSYALFWDLYDDINSSNSDRYIAAVCVMLAHNKSVPSNLTQWPETRNSTTPFIDVYKKDIMGVEQVKVNTFSRVGSDVKIAWGWGDNTSFVSYQFQGNPFEFVHVKMYENFQFTNIQGHQLQAGEEFVVPACWVYWILNRQNTIENWEAVRIGANILAATITLGSSAPLWLVLTEIALNAADIGLAAYEDDIKSGNYPEYEALYYKLEGIVMLGDITFFTSAVTNGLRKWLIKQSDLSGDIRATQKVSGKFDQLKTKVSEAIASLKNLAASAVSGDPLLFIGQLEQILIDLKIQTYGKYFDNAPEVAVSFQQGEYLMVKTSSKSGISVAEVVEQGEDVYLRELRWADDFYDPALDGDLGRVLYEFEDVPVKQLDGSVSGKDLEIVEAVGSKGIFVREVGSFSWVDDLTGNGWDNNLRTLLKSDLETNPSLFDNVGDLAGAEAWKKLSHLPQSVRTNPTNLLQRSLLDEYADGIASASNARKGNFGEIGADLDLNSKDYNSLIDRIDDIDSPGHNGLDGVFEKNGQYYVVEGKYTGSASLNSANEATGLPRQMSDDWIATRDWSGVNLDPGIIQNLLDTKNYTRLLAKVAPDGSVTYRLIGADGYVITGNAGIFNP